MRKAFAGKNIMMNPQVMMQLMAGINKFKENHPKFATFLMLLVQGGVPEGTIIEMTVTRPGEDPITANLKVLDLDIELMKSFKDLKS